MYLFKGDFTLKTWVANVFMNQNFEFSHGEFISGMTELGLVLIVNYDFYQSQVSF